MTKVFGSHLLGRNVSPPDERDYKLANFLGLGVDRASSLSDPTDLINLGIAELKLTSVTFARWAATSYPDVTKTHWWKALNYFAQAKASLNPVPAPPSTTLTEWVDPEEILDQADTNHCVGFSAAQWGNTLPINDKFTDQDGHDIYYECKVIDGEPGQENGTDLRSQAKALKNRRRLGIYAFAASVDEVVAWIQQKGPVVMGTDWLENMFDPNAKGFVDVRGAVAGGHAYVANGYDSADDSLLFINSWSAGWGDNGHFKMYKADMEKLFVDYGEALIAVELAI